MDVEAAGAEAGVEDGAAACVAGLDCSYYAGADAGAAGAPEADSKV